jgi:hypothetical protein
MSNYSSELRSNVLNEISAKFGFETVEDEESPRYHSNFWTADIQGTGSQAIAIVSRKNEMPSVFTNLDANNQKIFSDASHASLLSTTGTFYHLESKTIVLCPIFHNTIGSNQLCLEKGMVPNTRGTLVPTPGEAISQIELEQGDSTVSFHPFIEGVVVYRWKLGGQIFFSTRKRTNASLSRCGNSRLLPECMRSLGCPLNSQLFPDESSWDGEGIAYVFLVSHKTFSMVSNLDLGDGRVFFIGAMEAATGRFLSPLDPRIKWNNISEVLDCSEQQELYETPSHVVVEPVETVAETPEENHFLTETACLKESQFYEAEEAYKVEHSLKIAAEYGDSIPFPPRSVARLLENVGNAEMSVKSALEEESDDETPEGNEICFTPTFTISEANNFLSLGPFHPNFNRNFDTTTLPAVDHLLTTGEPVLMRLTHNDGTTTFTKIQPASNTWRLTVGGYSNIKLRVSELSTLSKNCANAIAQGSAFDFNIFSEGTVSNMIADHKYRQLPLEYPQIFPFPPSFVYSQTSFYGKEIFQDLKNLLQEGKQIISIPESIYTNCQRAEIVDKQSSPTSSVCPHYMIADRLFWWACLMMVLCVSPSRRSEVVEASLGLRLLEDKVINNMMNLARNKFIVTRVMRSDDYIPHVDYVFMNWKFEKTGSFIPAAAISTKLLFKSIRHCYNNDCSMRDSIKSIVDQMSGEDIYSAHQAFHKYTLSFLPPPNTAGRGGGRNTAGRGGGRNTAGRGQK